ncbi:MAG: LptE family protein [Candidatus Omnitrophica bacterium]|nr:LptE family protein [Candidatus Omnitrophota bacterium]
MIKIGLKKLICCLLFVICAFSFIGCGYTTRSMISNKYKTIYITPFINRIDFTKEEYVATKYRLYRPGMETDITNAVSDKYLFDGNLRPVKVDDSADLVLKGELMEFRKDPLTYNDNDDVTQYRVNLIVNLTLLDKKENKIVWQENNFTGLTEYFVTGTQSISEATAINNALADLARRVVERTVEEW